MESALHKKPGYWSEVLHDAWEDFSWIEIISEGVGGVVVAGFLLHYNVAEHSESRELILECIGCAIAPAMVGFLIRFLFITPSKMYGKIEARLEVLGEKLKPKFKLECGPKIMGCINPVVDRATFYRLQVKTDCANEIENCIGHLTKVEKEGLEVFSHESLELPFAPSEDSDSFKKTIFPSVPYYLDVLMVVHNERRPVHVAAKGVRSLVINQVKDLVFLTPGEYILYVSVSGKGVDTIHARLKFHWKDDVTHSTIEKVDS